MILDMTAVTFLAFGVAAIVQGYPVLGGFLLCASAFLFGYSWGKFLHEDEDKE